MLYLSSLELRETGSRNPLDDASSWQTHDHGLKFWITNRLNIACKEQCFIDLRDFVA
jgi:hypothetical protein